MAITPNSVIEKLTIRYKFTEPGLQHYFWQKYNNLCFTQLGHRIAENVNGRHPYRSLAITQIYEIEVRNP